MRRAGLSVCVIVSLVVAVLLGIGVVRETTGQPWAWPAPPQTPTIFEVVRQVFIVVTPTPSPIPTLGPEPTATPHPHRSTTGVVQIDKPAGNPAWTRLGGE